MMTFGRILTWRLARQFSVIAALLAASISPAIADDNYGCKVLLCLANPAGPRAEPQCRDDIDRLYRDLHRGKPMPVCNMASADASSGTAQAVQRQVWHDPCPDGTSALAAGERAIVGIPAPGGGFNASADPGAANVGIGDTDGLSYDEYGELIVAPYKVCVGNQVGVVYATSYESDWGYSTPVGVYDRVVLLDAYSTPDVIDVLINGALTRRVRY